MMKNLISLCILLLNFSSYLLAQDSSCARTLNQLILGEWQLEKQYLKSFQSKDTLQFFEKGTKLTFTKDSLHIKNENTPRYYLQQQNLQYEIVKDSLNLFLTHHFKRKKSQASGTTHPISALYSVPQINSHFLTRSMSALH